MIGNAWTIKKFIPKYKTLNLKPEWLPYVIMMERLYSPNTGKGLPIYLPPKESKRSLEMAVNAWKTRSQLANKIGKGKYVLAEYKKVKRITAPLDENHLLYITPEVSADHDKILKAIVK